MDVRRRVLRDALTAASIRRSSTTSHAPAARLASVAARTWPAISDSPSTNDSSPLATRNRCRAAAPPSVVALRGVSQAWADRQARLLAAVLHRARGSSGSDPDGAPTAVEHTTVPWDALPGKMRQVGEFREWQLAERPERLPHTFTLQAVKGSV